MLFMAAAAVQPVSLAATVAGLEPCRLVFIIIIMLPNQAIASTVWYCSIACLTCVAGASGEQVVHDGM
jgi:hypothetical protein